MYCNDEVLSSFRFEVLVLALVDIIEMGNGS